MFIRSPNALKALPCDSLFFLVEFAEFGERNSLKLLLCGFEFINLLPLLVNFLEKVLHVTIDVVHVSGHLRLDVLCSIGIA